MDSTEDLEVRCDGSLWKSSLVDQSIVVEGHTCMTSPPGPDEVLILVSDGTNWSAVGISRALIATGHSCTFTRAIQVADQNVKARGV